MSDSNTHPPDSPTPDDQPDDKGLVIGHDPIVDQSNSSDETQVNQVDLSDSSAVTREWQDDETDQSTDDGGLLAWMKGLLPGGDEAEGDTAEYLTDVSDQLSTFIASDGITWHDNYVELGGDTCAKTYMVTEWPYEARSHFMYSLYRAPEIKFNSTLHYNPSDRSDALDKLNSYQATLADKVEGEFSEYIPNTESIAETLGHLREMKRRIDNEGRRLYEVSIYITVYADSKDQLEAVDRQIKEIMEAQANFSLEPTDNYPDKGILSTSPLGLNAMADVRETATQLVDDRAAAMTFPFVKDTVLEEGGTMMGYNEANRTPVLMDIYDRNNGYNKLVIGAIGSGKSFSEGQYLLRHYNHNPSDNIVIIDPMGGFRGVTTALDAEHIVVNGSSTINPLHIEPTPREAIEAADGDLNPYRMKIEEVRWFFQQFFSLQGKQLEGGEWAPFNEALTKAYRDAGITEDPATHDNDSPIIEDIRENLNHIAENPEQYAETSTQKELSRWQEAATELRMTMNPFREGGEFYNLNGENQFNFDDTTNTYLDMSPLDANESGTDLMMRLLFSLLYQQVKNSSRRSIIAIDEAHKIIGEGDNGAADHWQEVFRHSRHHDLSIHLLSQSFEDFFQTEEGDGANEAAKTMAEQCAVRRIHKVENVNRKLASDALDLTDDHCQYIENAVPGQEGRGYTTALLDVNDVGRIGLRIEATKTEVSIVDYEPGEDWESEGGDNVVPPSPTVQRALSLKDTMQRGLAEPAQDDLLTEVLLRMDLEKFTDSGRRQITDAIIQRPDNEYTEADRKYLLMEFGIPQAQVDSSAVERFTEIDSIGEIGTVELTETDDATQARISRHLNAIVRAEPSNAELRELADNTANVDSDSSIEKIVQKIAEARAFAEIKVNGHESAADTSEPLSPLFRVSPNATAEGDD